MKMKRLIVLSMIALFTVGSVSVASAQQDKNSKKVVATTDFTPEELAKMKSVGVTPDQMLGIRKSGMTLDEFVAIRNASIAREEAITFENAKLSPSRTSIVKPEYYVVAKGESVRIKCLMDSKTLRFEIKGVGEATQEDLNKGEWIPSVKLEESGFIRYRVTRSFGKLNPNEEDRIIPMVNGFFIVVVDADKIEEVRAKYKEFSDKKDYIGRSQYIIEVVGEDFYNKAADEHQAALKARSL
jgi:hypothetical protein